MAISKNNPILKNHFRKDWQKRVTVHFDQAGKKASRRAARAAKAVAVAPRPTESLRPVVRCPTIRYNRRVRAGRGFSLEELKAAGIPRKFARTIGIAVDHRRQNRNVEAFEQNVQRLKEYNSRLILFPRRSAKGAAKPAGEEVQIDVTASFPVPSNKITLSTAAVPADEGSAYRKLRLARSYARYEGAKEKRAKDKAEAEK